MLTTTDNPYDPYTQYEEWEAFDTHAGYNTPSLLARVVVTSEALSDEDQEEDIRIGEEAIVDNDVLGIYKIV